ncbi:glyoxalase superfamily protein [Sphingomonas bacterium]|uniref:glyoxalase superfamily protein n=1 Tax=Sphingomonas bacterium TaxID=1895847 RepID=UPI00262FF81C|nr:glyoxalase superfamily protein [Sphingomonas bacterium]MDB5680152.1 putative glyoxalase family protein [Sphingomonas bacterium]
MNRWYTRAIVPVADVHQSVVFYARLGFGEDWRHPEASQLLVAQVSRQGCELLLSCQWPTRKGHSLTFISLDDDEIDAVRAEFERNGVEVRDGHWGYRLMIVEDPDGNQLLFPYSQARS